MKERSFKTACGNKIQVTDRSVKYMQNYIKTLVLLEEAVDKITLPSNEDELCTTIDFGREIGKTDCLRVPRNTRLNFAVRSNKELCQTPLRVVMGAERQSTSKFTVIASNKNGVWVLRIAYIGPLAPRMPNDPYFRDKRDTPEFKEAFNFWKEHALLWDYETMGIPYQSTWNEVLRK